MSGGSAWAGRGRKPWASSHSDRYKESNAASEYSDYISSFESEIEGQQDSDNIRGE
jgi:hypothetical protein